MSTEGKNCIKLYLYVHHSSDSTRTLFARPDKLIELNRTFEQGSTLKIVEGAGHALPSQTKREYNEWIKSNIERTV